MREHTSLVFGQILSVSGFSPLSAYSPFGYFSYDPTPADPTDWGCSLTHSCKNDEHMYVFVITRDEGPLVYNPVNGDFIGRSDDLMQEMGCDVQPYEKPFFPIPSLTSQLDWAYQRCQSDKIDEILRQYDALNLNSTEQIINNSQKRLLVESLKKEKEETREVSVVEGLDITDLDCFIRNNWTYVKAKVTNKGTETEDYVIMYVDFFDGTKLVNTLGAVPDDREKGIHISSGETYTFSTLKEDLPIWTKCEAYTQDSDTSSV